MNLSAILKKSPLIAILRGITPNEAVKVADALLEGGVLTLEIPLNSPDALESIARCALHCEGRQLVGAGTVLTAAEADAVADAGGKFILSPNTNESVIRETKRRGLISIPGFMTPTEAFAAIGAGADFLKLFPAGQFGAGFIQDLKAVITKPILAFGGVNGENLAAFLKVCPGAGVGSALYRPGKTPDQVKTAAQTLIAAAGCWK